MKTDAEREYPLLLTAFKKMKAGWDPDQWNLSEEEAAAVKVRIGKHLLHVVRLKITAAEKRAQRRREVKRMENLATDSVGLYPASESR